MNEDIREKFEDYYCAELKLKMKRDPEVIASCRLLVLGS